MGTIAAIATAHGPGGVGMIRVSGDRAIEVVEKIFKTASGVGLANLTGYMARYGRICDGETVVDDAVALVFRNPHSYTGEDVVELTCHGGESVMRMVLRLIFAAGARPAGPGEFTKRAFLNGKIDLTQAEAVMDIISASSEQAAKLAVAAHEGALFKTITEIKTELVSVAANISAWSDYPDEGIENIDVDFLKLNIKKIMSFYIIILLKHTKLITR